MFVKPVRIESLGNTTYLVGSLEAKECAVIDPVRDVDLYLREAEALGVHIVYALETHVHNDFVSGSRELAARTGAVIGASAAAGLQFEHRPLQKGDVVTMGEVRLEVVPTPGHTPEHIAFLATDTSKGKGPHAAFTGGALLVGGVARADLLGKQLAPYLGRWFYRTIREALQPLDDSVEVFPTHGGGSFCLVTPTGATQLSSTIGQERHSNPYFQATTEEEFLELALGELPSYPTYYKRMATINRRGPRLLGTLPTLFPLSPREVWVRVQGEGMAIDTRPTAQYAAVHIPGAYSIPAGSSFSTWVGWLVEPGRPLAFVLEDPAVREELVRQLIRIGYDALEGYLEGGMAAWERAGLPVATVRTVTAQDLYRALEGGNGPLPLDVRFDHEWQEGHVPGALHVELGQLPEHVDGLPRDRAYATVCAAGVRAATAASVLEREGFRDIAILTGGTGAWKEAGLPLERPSE